MPGMNDNCPVALGDRVRLRGQPWTQGTVWEITPDMIQVMWDDPDEVAQIRDARLLEKITHAPSAA